MVRVRCEAPLKFDVDCRDVIPVVIVLNVASGSISSEASEAPTSLTLVEPPPSADNLGGPKADRLCMDELVNGGSPVSRRGRRI